MKLSKFYNKVFTEFSISLKLYIIHEIIHETIYNTVFTESSINLKLYIIHEIIHETIYNTVFTESSISLKLYNTTKYSLNSRCYFTKVEL